MAANLTEDQRLKLQEIESRQRRWHHPPWPGKQPQPSASP
jgi:hypothetical protein